jgi:Planctomycete cytochrome C
VRLDSFDLLMKGGKDGPVIVAGDPEKSLLLHRVTLPPDHKRFMPAEGRPPLHREENKLIEAWIQQGLHQQRDAAHGCHINQQANIYVSDWSHTGRVTKLVREIA